jgi:hypothetical protein
LLGYCFWLLTRLVEASREHDFVAALDRLNTNAPASDPALGLVSELTQHVRMEVADHPESGPFG